MSGPLERNGVVIDDTDAEHLKFNAEDLIAILVKSVQELNAQNGALALRVAALEAIAQQVRT